MVDNTKDFLDITSKKLAKIEKKIQEMKFNIVIMSFYSDIKLIENTLLTYQAQGIHVDESLLSKIEKFKILLQSNKNLPELGRKFIELTEEFYNMRKQIYDKEQSNQEKEIEEEGISEQRKKRKIEYLSAYV